MNDKLLIILLIVSIFSFSLSVSAQSTFINSNDIRYADSFRYIDPNDPRANELDPSIYVDREDPRNYIELNQLNGVKPFQGNITFYSSNNSVQIGPDYFNSKINLTCDINGFSGNVNWVQLQNYPSGCPAGQAVQVIDDTLTCITVGSDINSGNFTGDILGKQNQLSVTNGIDRLFGSSDVNLSLPQDINTTSSPSFSNMSITNDLNVGKNIQVDRNAVFGSSKNILTVGFDSNSVGINSAASTSGIELQILDPNSNTATLLMIDNNASLGIKLQQRNKTLDLINSDTNGDFNLSLNNGSRGADLKILGTNGAWYAPNITQRAIVAQALQWTAGSGNIYALSSDSTYKDDITDINAVYDTSLIWKLKPKAYKDKETGVQTFGLIAEEVFQTVPYLAVLSYVDQPFDSIKNPVASVNYSQMGVIQLEEMKKMKEKNDALEAQIVSQNQTISNLQKKIKTIIQIVCPPEKITPLCMELNNTADPV